MFLKKEKNCFPLKKKVKKKDLFIFYKPLCQGLTFNRLKWGSYSAMYETPTQKQVVYGWLSTLAPGSPGTCYVWWARGLPPFWLCHMSQEEGLSTSDPSPGTWWAAPRGTVCWQGLQGTSYPRPTEGKHYPVTRGKQGHYKKRKL